MAHLSDKLFQLESQNDMNYIVITKFLGHQKSSHTMCDSFKIILSHLFVLIMDAKFGLIQSHLNDESHSVYGEFNRLSNEISQTHNDLFTVVKDLKELIKSIEKFFKNQTTTIVLLLDDIDHFISEENFDFIINMDLSPNFKIVYTSTQPCYSKNMFFLKLDSSLNVKNSISFMENLLEKSSRRIFSNIQIERIKNLLALNLIDCNYFYLTILSDIIKKWPSSSEMDETLSEFDECFSVKTLWKYFLKLITPSHCYSYVFYLNQFDLSESELDSLLGLDKDELSKFSIGTWCHLVYELKNYLLPVEQNSLLVYKWQICPLMNDEIFFLFRLDSNESDKKIENILEYFHQKPFYFIDTNGRVQYNLSKLNNLPRLITKMNNPNRMQSEFIKLILFNYEFIYARSLLGDYEFLTDIASILNLNQENIFNIDIVMAYIFYDINKNELNASSHSILEQMRIALFDTCFNRVLFDQHFFGKYSDENLSVLAFAHGKKFCLEKRSALVPFNTSWYFIVVISIIQYTGTWTNCRPRHKPSTD
jgi:hypothetical protein